MLIVLTLFFSSLLCSIAFKFCLLSGELEFQIIYLLLGLLLFSIVYLFFFGNRFCYGKIRFTRSRRSDGYGYGIVFYRIQLL